MAEILDVVNERDEIVGQVEREQVHRDGLICRMVLVLFYTPDKKIILQRRSMLKKGSPGKLTTSVSGHVEAGLSYDEAALKETFEETGVAMEADKLSKVAVRYAFYDENGYQTKVMRASYAYLYDGAIEDLKIEDGEGVGFEVMSIDELRRLQADQPEELAPYVDDEAGLELIDYIEAL